MNRRFAETQQKCSAIITTHTLYMGNLESEKMQTLLLEYIKDFDITKAAKRAGVSRSEARRIIENSPGEIAGLIEERNQRLEIDADWVVDQLAAAFNADLSDVLYPDGTVRPVQEWPTIWRKVANGVKVREQIDKDGNYVGRVIEFKTPDAIRILELIGKHVNVNAFREQIEVGTQADLAERLRRGRERLINSSRAKQVASTDDGATVEVLPAPDSSDEDALLVDAVADAIARAAPVDDPVGDDDADATDQTDADATDQTDADATGEDQQAAGVSFL